MKEEFKESHSSEYDERSQTLTAVKTYKKTGVISTISNEYKGEKAIKDYLKYNADAKKSAQKQIDSLEENIKELKVQEDTMKKGLKPLTLNQEKLINNLKVIQTYEAIEKVRSQIKGTDKNLKVMQSGMKKDNVMFEEIKNKCKIKLN